MIFENHENQKLKHIKHWKLKLWYQQQTLKSFMRSSYHMQTLKLPNIENNENRKSKLRYHQQIKENINMKFMSLKH